MTSLLNKFTLTTTVIAILFVLKFLNPVLADPDFYWHLKTGEYIVSTLSIPSTDPFSFTFGGKPWVAHEWLTEALLYGAMQAFGYTGIRLLIATMLCASFYLLYRLALKLGNDDGKALVISLAFFVPLLPYGSPRPQILTFFFFTAYLYLLLDFKYSGTTKRLWLLPAMMLLWVNLHGAYLVGIALLMIFLATEWTMHLYADRGNIIARRNLTRLGMFTLATCLATLANPQFFMIWVYPFELVSLEVSKGIINEWQSPNFHLLGFKLYLILIIMFFSGLIYSRKKPDLTELFIPIFFISAGLVSARHLPLTCFVLSGFFSAFYRHVDLPFKLPKVPRFDQSQARGINSQINPTVAGVINLGLLLTVLLLAASGSVYRDKENQVAETVPVGAVNYVIENKISGNMFNDYNVGGYLIYKLASMQKVFIDGRADLYGDKFVTEYLQIYAGQEGWKQKFDKFSIDYVICDKNAALRQLLLADGSFKEAYVDSFHSVLLRDIPRFRPLLAGAATPRAY